MDLGDLIINSLKIEQIRESTFPLNYYILKGMYSRTFYKRSKYFIDSMVRLYDSFATSLDLAIFDESVILPNYSDKNLDITNIGNNTFFRSSQGKNEELLDNIDKKKIFNQNGNNNDIESTFNADIDFKTSNNNNYNIDDCEQNNFSVMNDSIVLDLKNSKQNNFMNNPNISIINPRNNETINNQTIIESNNEIENIKSQRRETNAYGPNDTLNITINKYKYSNLSHQMKSDGNFYLNFILNFSDEHILDKEENYTILHLIKNFIFSDEDPASSTLLMSYSLYASSIELIFCLKQAEKLPNIICTPKEKKFITVQNQKIKSRIRNFLNAWLNMPNNKAKLQKKKNEILKLLLKKELEEFVPQINLIINDQNFYLMNTIFENPLIENYISVSKIIKDQTPFYFNTLELARQICLIDHENFCKISLQEFSNYIVKGIISKNFELFRIRDLQLKCYILSLYYKQDYLDKKKEIVKNLIILAKMLKGLKNFQTCFTIISVLIKLDIKNKKDIWRGLEIYERDLFRSLRDELINMENNSGEFHIMNFVNPNFNLNNSNSGVGNVSNSTNFTNANNNLNSSGSKPNLKNQNIFVEDDKTMNIYLNKNNTSNANLTSKNSGENLVLGSSKDLHNSGNIGNTNELAPCVPNINLIRNINSYISNRLKLAVKLQENLNIAKEYKFFIQDLINKRNFKYSFHKVNPIHDFFSFGFIEILRLVKFKKIITYNPENPDFERIYEELIKKINEKKK